MSIWYVFCISWFPSGLTKYFDKYSVTKWYALFGLANQKLKNLRWMLKLISVVNQFVLLQMQNLVNLTNDEPIIFTNLVKSRAFKQPIVETQSTKKQTVDTVVDHRNFEIL